mmetsp:Transcript_32049/g.83891  ORF Transcript_32049/g.83891 Transcript_32049/m.83891 type:complete len:358 (-) Transcript_32049:631-1704(-)
MRGVARPPGRHLQVHRGRQGDRGRRRRQQRPRGQLRDRRARRERRRALGRRHARAARTEALRRDVPPRQAHHARDRQGAQHLGAVQPAAPLQGQRGQGDRGQRARVAHLPLRLQDAQGRLHRDRHARHDRRARRARANLAARHRLRRHQGADVLVHAPRRRGPRAWRRDGVDRRGGHLRRGQARGHPHLDARGGLPAAQAQRLPVHRPAPRQARDAAGGQGARGHGARDPLLAGHVQLLRHGAQGPVQAAAQAFLRQDAQREHHAGGRRHRPGHQRARFEGERGLRLRRLPHPPQGGRLLRLPAHRRQAVGSHHRGALPPPSGRRPQATRLGRVWRHVSARRRPEERPRVLCAGTSR